MKKVLIIQQLIPEYRTDFFNLLRTELQKNEIELDVVYGTENSSYQYGHAKIGFGYTYSSKKIRVLSARLSWQPVLKYISGHELVIVEAANRLLVNYLLITMRRPWGFRLGFWGHGRNLQAPQDSPGNKFSALYIKRCDWWWAYTSGVKKFLVEKGYDPRRVTIVQNAIDTTLLKRYLDEIDEQQVQGLKKKLEITSPNVAIFCGGMYEEKRIPFIIDTCYLVKEKVPDFHMIFIGSGKDEGLIRNAAEENNWIHFEGVKQGIDRVKYFKISSLQLMPGAVGLGILDSFALKTPIVTTCSSNHGPEIEYLENYVNGVITANSLGNYASEVVQLFVSGRYTDLLKGCERSAEVYTLGNMVENFKNGIIACLKHEEQ